MRDSDIFGQNVCKFMQRPLKLPSAKFMFTMCVTVESHFYKK